jgi:hypothetical protein
MTTLIQRMIQDDFLRFALGKTSEITEAAEAWAALGGEHGTRSRAHSNSIPEMSVPGFTSCVRVLQRATRRRRSDCFTRWAWRNGNLCNTLWWWWWCVCVCVCALRVVCVCFVRWVLTLLDCDRLSPLAFGLLRLGKIRQAFQLYREKMQKKVSSTIDRVRRLSFLFGSSLHAPPTNPLLSSCRSVCRELLSTSRPRERGTAHTTAHAHA